MLEHNKRLILKRRYSELGRREKKDKKELVTLVWSCEILTR